MYIRILLSTRSHELIIIACIGTNDGCSAYPQLKADNESIVKIALMWRGNCTFATKAINAQNALADAIIVINNAGSLVYMGAGNSAPSINTPGMMIGNADGLALINATSQRTVWVSMRYFLPQPDDRVEWDLYTIANDPNVSTTQSMHFHLILFFICLFSLFLCPERSLQDPIQASNYSIWCTYIIYTTFQVY